MNTLTNLKIHKIGSGTIEWCKSHIPFSNDTPSHPRINKTFHLITLHSEEGRPMVEEKLIPILSNLPKIIKQWKAYISSNLFSQTKHQNKHKNLNFAKENRHRD